MLNTQQENLKSNRSDLQRELEAAGAKFKGKTCKCIFHADGNASAGIFEKNGHWFFKCHGCGVAHDIFSLRAALNKSTVGDELQKVGGNAVWVKGNEKPTEVFKTIEQIAARFSNVEAVYKYTHPQSGIVELATIRWRDERHKKHFIQVTPTPGGYWMKGVELDNPIYNRTRVAAAECVVVVEGEKCVHALTDLGIVATTSPGGALKGGQADWSPLAGKNCILWPDADEPEGDWIKGKGDEHMRQVQKILLSLNPPARVFWVDPTALELTDGQDVADLIERYKGQFSPAETTALVEEILADAEPVGIMGEFIKEVDAIIAGERRVIELPWRFTSKSSRALMPGKVTCICGDGGSGKSLWVGQCLVVWQQLLNVKACIYHLEDDRNYHMLRTLAQLAWESQVTDAEWVERNGQAMRDLVAANQSDLEVIGSRIFEAPDEQTSLDMLAKWVESRAKEGYQVIIIDPVTAAEAAARPWIEDLKFITRCKVVCRRYGCRVIFVTHPRTGAKAGKSNHNDMAGGAAYPRFAHTVFWLERNDAENEVAVYDGQMTQYLKPNRILNIAKARNGPGAGRRVAFNFNAKTLCYEELGMIERQL